MIQVLRAHFQRIQQVFTVPSISSSEAAPEAEFLNNAATMAHYAKQEIKQFATWTQGTDAYQESTESLLQQLESISKEVQMLRQQYQHRAAFRNS